MNVIAHSLCVVVGGLNASDWLVKLTGSCSRGMAYILSTLTYHSRACFQLGLISGKLWYPEVLQCRCSSVVRF